MREQEKDLNGSRDTSHPADAAALCESQPASFPASLPGPSVGYARLSEGRSGFRTGLPTTGRDDCWHSIHTQTFPDVRRRRD
jgi:hypothetical protein